jgi:histidinol dehydrogenase
MNPDLIRIFSTQTDDVLGQLRERTVFRSLETERIVSEIIDDVRVRGDAALLDNARKFDAPGLTSIEVDFSEIGSIELPKIVLDAIERSMLQVQAFHARQLKALTEGWKPMLLQTVEQRRSDGQPLHSLPNFEYRWHKNPMERQGWTPTNSVGGLGQRLLPVKRAGVYVPGGNATYPSSVVMNVIPAQCAGVNAVFVTTPARRDGTLDPAVIAALAYCGVAKAFKTGGAAAIAALAYGTETVPRVDTIVGPGNRFVNEAKRQVWGSVGLDGYAGPSEVCVLCDSGSNASFAAADLLTQIEHAPDNAGFLVCTDKAKLQEILEEVENQMVGAKRESTLRAALANESIAILARDEEEACDIVNAIAPEHLSIATREPELTMERIYNAGCILLGDWSAESAGDFAAGPSHTLPTSGAARFGSPVSVMNFLKFQSIVRLSKDDLQDMLPTLEAYGEIEGFPAHAKGARIRFE